MKFTLHVHLLMFLFFLSDTIFVLKDGNIIESGTHEGLIVMDNGVYKTMWETQENSDAYLD